MAQAEVLRLRGIAWRQRKVTLTLLLLYYLFGIAIIDIPVRTGAYEPYRRYHMLCSRGVISPRYARY